MRKIVLVILFGCFGSLYSFSQGTLKGKIIDSTSKLPLGMATVTVFRAADTVLVTYRLSNPEGEFKIPGIPYDINCRVVISYSGYYGYRKEFSITSSKPIEDIGSIYMFTNSTALEEVVVYAERPPVVFRKDTIEFNASSFKTLPNALVEDLLKKLPGVQVDKDGNIVVNGKPVNRILVDGKTFFGDDPKMATRNLPANVIDKVQVTDDKDELLRNGDDNLNNVGKIVNITLKKGVKKGWFGKLYAGAGTSSLYEAGGIANIYRDTLQVSVLGYMNNMNKAGFSFSELMQAGGLDRSRSNSNGSSISIWNSSSGGSGVSINGVNFGGAQNYGGISTSKGIGINLNHSPSIKKSFFAQYFYGNVLVDRTTITDIKQFNEDTIINTNTRLTGGVVTNSHNIGLGARLKPDSLTNIVLNANYLIGLSNEDRISDINSVNNILGQLSAGDVRQNNLGNTYYYRHSASITKLSRKKAGRRISIFHRLEMNNRFNDNTTETDIRFLYPSPFDSTAAQLRTERIPRTDASINFNYSDPLNKKLTFRVNGGVDYGKLNNEVGTFNKGGSQDYDTPNESLSSDFKRTSYRVSLSPGIEFKWKQVAITPAFRAQLQHVNNDLASLSAPIIQNQTNILPLLTVTYKQLNFNYNKDIALPSYTNLIPVRDNTNPYFIYKGNPDLTPMKRNNLSVNYQFNNTKRSLNASVYANGAFTDNDVVQSITVDAKGVQTIIPVNADGSRNFYINYNLYKQYKNNQKFIFSWNIGGNYNYNRNKLLYNGEESWQNTFNFGNWVGVGLNWNDKVEYNANIGKGVNFTRYTNSAFNKLEIQTANWDNEIVLRFIKHVIIESQYGITYTSNVPAGVPKEVIRWNAAVNITMLRDETGVLKLSVFDILDRNNSVWVNASRNMITTTQNNVLGQYFMATFTYNVRAAGMKKKIGGRERLFLF